MSRKLVSLFIVIAVTMVSSLAFATDTTGTIAGLRISAVNGSTNAHMQIKMTGTPNLCSSATSREYAYLDASDTQFDKLVSIALAAYLSGKTVVVDAVSQNGSGFYATRCQIKSLNLQ